VLSRLDSRSLAARRGLSDLSIRNLFIIPTIAFLIVFNIFPLIYSLGYSFTDFSASSNAPAAFVGLQNYRDLLNDDHVWNNFSVTARYVLLSVGGQVLLGFGVAMLLNRSFPFKGLFTTLLLIAIIFRTMEAFKTFDLAFIMSSQETTELIAIKLYRLAFQEWQTGPSCALAYMVLIMVLAITNIYVKYLNRAKDR
jgi:ABC-type sugar transport system permease subunit